MNIDTMSGSKRRNYRSAMARSGQLWHLTRMVPVTPGYQAAFEMAVSRKNFPLSGH